VDKSKVTDNARFVQDLGADSLDKVELVLSFEEEFKHEIPDDEAAKIGTVKDAVEFLLRSSVCTNA
jgi:acyl carrier protein